MRKSRSALGKSRSALVRCRALVILSKKSASQVRLAESNFQRRDKGIQAVLDAVMTLSARSIPSLPHASD